jgi:hypothetical protein
MELMNAQEAHALTHKYDNMEKVTKYITWAIESQRNYTFAKLDEQTKDKLLTLGYKVKLLDTDVDVLKHQYQIQW